MSLEDQRDPETEAFINTLEKSHIYKDMRAKYDEITEDGEKVFLDEYDEPVSKYISEKYLISKEEALDLYTFFEVEISKFHQRRLKGE